MFVFKYLRVPSYRDAVVSPDGARFAVSRVGLAQHHLEETDVIKSYGLPSLNIESWSASNLSSFSPTLTLPVLTAPWPSQAMATTGPESMYFTCKYKMMMIKVMKSS